MPRSEAPKDPRPYVRITEDYLDNRKLDDIDDPRAYLAHLASVIAAARSMTDGHFSLRAVRRRVGFGDDLVEAMVKQELWHLPGHTCRRCPQPKPGDAYVHDYMQHQRTAGEVHDLREKKRRAGQAGAAARWGTSVADGMAGAKQAPPQVRGRPTAEKRRGEEIPPPAPSADAGGFDPAWVKQLADTVTTVRPDWLPRDVRRALALRAVRERPPQLVERALLLLARDPATERPSRLGANHDFWAKAARQLAAEAPTARVVEPHNFADDGSGTCTQCPLSQGHAVHR